MQLVIGNKNYSSWSMRPWLLLRHFDIPFDEIRIPLFVPGYQDELRKYSPTLKVPVLIDGELTVWESSAICEYVSEKYLSSQALPADMETRALCRSYCAEMHGGFSVIRNQLPMNCRASKRVAFSDEVLQEIARIDSLWSQARGRFGDAGDYLFGTFSMADCMFAPVAMRFATYQPQISPASQDYVDTLLKNTAVRQWRSEAEVEIESLPEGEVGEDRNDR